MRTRQIRFDRSRSSAGARIGVAAAVLAVLAACSGGAGDGRGTSVGGDVGSVAATGAAMSVPITTVASESATIVTVQVTVGGGDPVTVLLDTGSSGLLVDASAAGSQTSATGGPFTKNYASGGVSGSLATAVVGIGGASTSQPITVGLIDVGGTSPFPDGTKGILGIATEPDSTSLFAPNLQMGSPYNAGSTLQVGATAGSSGTWTLGPVTTPAGSTSVPLVAQSASSTAPAGFPAFAKDVTLCWTIGSTAASCGPTDLDTGNDTPALNATTYAADGPVRTVLPSGRSIAVAPPNGAPLWSFTTGQTVGTDAVKLSSLGEDTQFNTGLPFFHGRTIAWNYAGGELLIGPTA